jgi:hypothetical protein
MSADEDSISALFPKAEISIGCQFVIGCCGFQLVAAGPFIRILA